MIRAIQRNISGPGFGCQGEGLGVRESWSPPCHGCQITWFCHGSHRYQCPVAAATRPLDCGEFQQTLSNGYTHAHTNMVHPTKLIAAWKIDVARIAFPTPAGAKWA